MAATEHSPIAAPPLDDTSTRRSAFAILKNRDFRLFWFGACVSFIGSWVQMVAMGLLVYRLTHSKAWLGAIGLAGGLPTTIFMLFGGVIADRVNKRTLVLWTQSLYAVNACTLAALVWTNTIQIWHLVALAAVNGLVFAADGPARQAMVFDLVGSEDLAAGVALQSAAFNVARIIGPVVGSLVYTTLGAGWCFFLNGISFIAIIFAILFVKTDLSQRGDAQGSVWHGLVEGLRYLRSNRSMRSVVGLTAITSVFAFSVYGTLMPALADEMLGIGERDRRYGLLFSAIGLGSVMGAYMVGRSAAVGRRGWLMLAGAVLFGVSLLALAKTTQIVPAIALFTLIGLAAISQLATANSLTQSLAPERLRGRALSAHMFAMGGLQPVGAVVAGFVAQRWSVSAAIVLGAGVFLAYTLAVMVRRPEVARLA